MKHQETAKCFIVVQIYRTCIQEYRAKSSKTLISMHEIIRDNIVVHIFLIENVTGRFCFTILEDGISPLIIQAIKNSVDFSRVYFHIKYPPPRTRLHNSLQGVCQILSRSELSKPIDWAGGGRDHFQNDFLIYRTCCIMSFVSVMTLTYDNLWSVKVTNFGRLL